MSQTEPLHDLLFTDRFLELPTARLAKLQAAMSFSLYKLGQFLDDPPAKTNLDDVEGDLYWTTMSPCGLPAPDVPYAQEQYRRVFERGGSGATYMQERLLSLIAVSHEPVSIPFWLELLDLSKRGDQFRKQRRIYALAALAYLAIKRNEPAAYAALQQAARHDEAVVRGLAIYYLGRAYLEAERPLPSEEINTLRDIATQDPAFEPRFQSRTVLRNAGHTLPPDNVEGVYAFKVKFMWNKRTYRTIEVGSKQTLDDLHYAFQHAIKWDSDHLYSFFMNGVKYDDRFAFACPYEEDRPPWTSEAVIGELGLVKKHKFLYYFDYGDSHEFEVEVVDIRPQAEPDRYPRVVDSKGEAPRQYGR